MRRKSLPTSPTLQRDSISDRSSVYDATIATVVALLIRVVYDWVALRGYRPESDAQMYLSLASSWAKHGDLLYSGPFGVVHPTAFRPPLYPILLGAFIGTGGPPLGIAEALNCFLGASAAGLTVVAARSIGAPRSVRLIAGGLAAAVPLIVVADGPPLSEPLARCLLLGAVIAYSNKRWATFGLLLGALILTRPATQVGAVILLLSVILVSGWRHAARAVVVLLLFLSPWVVRNITEVGSASLVTSNGFNLASAYNPSLSENKQWTDAIRDPELAVWRRGARTEAELDRQLGNQALAYLYRHPTLIPKHAVQNSRNLWNLSPTTNTELPDRVDGRNLAFLRRMRLVDRAFTVLGLVALATCCLWRITRLLPIAAVAMTAGPILILGVPRLADPGNSLACIALPLVAAKALALRRSGESGLKIAWSAPRRPAS